MVKVASSAIRGPSRVTPGAVTWRAPCRIHWGLFNESASQGWIDGGLGIGLNSPFWQISLGGSPAKKTPTVADMEAKRTIQALSLKWGTKLVSVDVSSGPKFHVGLGSRTALSLLVGTAYAEWVNIQIDAARLAKTLGRAGTSGVGLHVHQKGGVVADRGHLFPSQKMNFGPSSARLSSTAPRLWRHWDPPEEWMVVLVTSPGKSSLSGQKERAFFKENCPVPDEETTQILLKFESVMIPAMGMGDLAGVHEFLDSIQNLGLKAREWTLQARAQMELRLEWSRLRVKAPGLSPMGLSSLGPTLFLLSSEPDREVKALQGAGVRRSRIHLSKIAQGGAAIVIDGRNR